MSLRLDYAFVSGQFAQKFAEIQKPIAAAATGAMNDAAQLAKTGGRANIASAGFSTRWQNALRADVYPRGGKTSMSPAAFIHHNIPYSGVFETGAVIRGKPMLWLPIHENLPLQARGKQWTPKDFVAKLGPLRSVNRPGHPPMLVGKVAVGGSGATLALPSGASSRKGKRARDAFGKSKLQWKPVFIGLSAVSIGKKFNIAGVVAKVRGQLGALYLKNLKTD